MLKTAISPDAHEHFQSCVYSTIDTTITCV